MVKGIEHNRHDSKRQNMKEGKADKNDKVGNGKLNTNN